MARVDRLDVPDRRPLRSRLADVATTVGAYAVGAVIVGALTGSVVAAVMVLTFGIVGSLILRYVFGVPLNATTLDLAVAKPGYGAAMTDEIPAVRESIDAATSVRSDAAIQRPEEVKGAIDRLHADLYAKVEAAGRLPQDGTVSLHVADPDARTNNRAVVATWTPTRLRFFAVAPVAHDVPLSESHAVIRSLIAQVVAHVAAADLDPGDGKCTLTRLDPSALADVSDDVLHRFALDADTPTVVATWTLRDAQPDPTGTTPTEKEQHP